MTRKILNHLTILDPFTEQPYVEDGAIEVENGRIKQVHRKAVGKSKLELVDMEGKYVLPGMINTHTHFYSALALGMPAPERNPSTFVEKLNTIWWPLDRSLDEDMIRASFRVSLLESLRHGCTTVFDHHSSPNLTKGILDMLVTEAREMGVRIGIAFESSARDGDKIFQEQLKANLRAIRKFEHDLSVHAMLGLHASFTLEDSHLLDIKRAMGEVPGSGIHIHVSEDGADEKNAREHGYPSVVDRLDKFSLLNKYSIVAHGIHLTPADVDTLQRRGVNLVHNPTSNANNSVGILPTDSIQRLKPGLGTDGMQFNMLREAREGTLLRSGSKEKNANLLQLLFDHNTRIATDLFHFSLGHILAGQPADLAFYAPVRRTELSESNMQVHILRELDIPTDVMSAGEFRVRDGFSTRPDAEEIYASARSESLRLWEAVTKIRA